MTRAPAKPMVAPGSARMMSPSMAKLAVTPPVVGSVSTVRYKFPAWLWRKSAALTLAICINERMPSCILAPPETVYPTTGRLCWAAYSNRRAIFSPTTVPMLPIMKLGSITNRAQGSPPILAAPHTTPSFSREASLALRSFWS